MLGLIDDGGRDSIMIIRVVRGLSIALFLFTLFPVGSAANERRLPSKDTTFVVLVTWDGADKTPATGVYIEAHSFAVNYISEKSFILKMVKAGRYEAALPPGVYDVFVSEAGSIPRCKRELVGDHAPTPYWSLMLEHDHVYSDN